ncbi:MAG: hypothetical protein ACYC7D_12575 [Nitrososphaerales archaeon]
MSEDQKFGVNIERNVVITLHPFTEYFKGFEKVTAVRAIFGESTDQVLQNLKVEFFSSKFGYMSVSDQDGHLVISAHHLKTAELNVVYLDIIHELCHVKQFMDGRELFSSEFEYVDSPVEIEAYKTTVEEARRIGMSREEIVEYLRIEWITEEQHKRLAASVGVA